MTIEEQVVEALREKQLTLTTAESCTGGMIAQRITDVSGASAVFECGIVSYSNRIKAELLGVQPKTLETFGAVSEETAREMAEGIRNRAKADLAISVTGIAGPLSDDTNKPVGLIYIGFTDGQKTVVQKLCNDFKNDVRRKNREAAAEAALNMVWRYLEYGRI